MSSRMPILALVVVVAWLAGCSVRRVPTTPDPRATSPDAGAVYEPQREAASPPPPAAATAPAAEAPPNLDVPAPMNFDAPAVSVQDLAPPAPPAGSTAAPATAAPAAPVAGTAGFRVQVFAGRDAAVAEQVRQELEARLGTRAYVVHEEPYDKVRIGDCPTREACRELVERLRAAGYDALWVVPDQIAP